LLWSSPSLSATPGHGRGHGRGHVAVFFVFLRRQVFSFFSVKHSLSLLSFGWGFATSFFRKRKISTIKIFQACDVQVFFLCFCFVVPCVVSNYDLLKKWKITNSKILRKMCSQSPLFSSSNFSNSFILGIQTSPLWLYFWSNSKYTFIYFYFYTYIKIYVKGLVFIIYDFLQYD